MQTTPKRLTREEYTSWYQEHYGEVPTMALYEKFEALVFPPICLFCGAGRVVSGVCDECFEEGI